MSSPTHFDLCTSEGFARHTDFAIERTRARRDIVIGIEKINIDRFFGIVVVVGRTRVALRHTQRSVADFERVPRQRRLRVDKHSIARIVVVRGSAALKLECLKVGAHLLEAVLFHQRKRVGKQRLELGARVTARQHQQSPARHHYSRCSARVA